VLCSYSTKSTGGDLRVAMGCADVWMCGSRKGSPLTVSTVQKGVKDVDAYIYYTFSLSLFLFFFFGCIGPIRKICPTEKNAKQSIKPTVILFWIFKFLGLRFRKI